MYVLYNQRLHCIIKRVMMRNELTQIHYPRFLLQASLLNPRMQTMGLGRRPNLHSPDAPCPWENLLKIPSGGFCFFSLKTGFPRHPNVLARMSPAIWEVQLSCRWERHKLMNCQFLGHHTVREHTQAQRPISTHTRRPACSLISSCDFSTTEHKIKPSNLCCLISQNQLVRFFFHV